MRRTTIRVAESSRWLTRARLALWMAAIFVGLASALSIAYLGYRQASLDHELHLGMQERVDQVADVLSAMPMRPSDLDLLRVAWSQQSPPLFPTLRMTLLDPTGGVIATTPEPAPLISVAEIEAAMQSQSPSSIVVRRLVAAAGGSATAREMFLRRVTLPDGADAILIGVLPADGIGWTLDLTIQTLLASLAIGIAAAVIAAWVIARLAHAPLEELRRIAATLLPERLGETVDIRSLSPESAVLHHELQGVRQKLNEALQLQERFISNVSHELKTPIAVLLTEAQTLRRGHLPPAGRRFVESVIDEMRRLGRMAESFLALTRLRSGQTAVTMELHRLDDIVMDAIEGSAQMAKQHQVVLVASLSNGERELIVSGDSVLLRVMLDNIIRNAVRFSPSGERVTIDMEEDETECRIIVRDRGPGVPEDVVHRLFDRFTQSSEEESRGRGHGLGLSIAQGVAELHGGRISVRNHPEGGCEFTVTLPLRDMDELAATANGTEPTTGAAPPDPAGSGNVNGAGSVAGSDAAPGPANAWSPPRLAGHVESGHQPRA